MPVWESVSCDAELKRLGWSVLLRVGNTKCVMAPDQALANAKAMIRLVYEINPLWREPSKPGLWWRRGYNAPLSVFLCGDVLAWADGQGRSGLVVDDGEWLGPCEHPEVTP